MKKIKNKIKEKEKGKQNDVFGNIYNKEKVAQKEPSRGGVIIYATIL